MVLKLVFLIVVLMAAASGIDIELESLHKIYGQPPYTSRFVELAVLITGREFKTNGTVFRQPFTVPAGQDPEVAVREAVIARKAEYEEFLGCKMEDAFESLRNSFDLVDEIFAQGDKIAFFFDSLLNGKLSLSPEQAERIAIKEDIGSAKTTDTWLIHFCYIPLDSKIIAARGLVRIWQIQGPMPFARSLWTGQTEETALIRELFRMMLA